LHKLNHISGSTLKSYSQVFDLFFVQSIIRLIILDAWHCI